MFVIVPSQITAIKETFIQGRQEQINFFCSLLCTSTDPQIIDFDSKI